ncbi:transmembrane protein 94 isoform X1 [Spodoptera frugiperda]|uniref:Transmembrane protein 94 isoform X1 n=2 Tax=Spodoptera frugiperda TaxID=7108 RepID=A0A9R0F3Z0_SPOFR|nr:transmembrane protein 94 isoform X1 [Spodoptera frugiperda]
MANVKMDDSNLHSLGYTTKTALIKLRDDIRNVIEEHKKKNTTGLGLVRNIISFSSEKVLLSGVAYTITLIYIVCLVLTYIFGESVQAHAYLLWEAFFLIVILLVNFLVAFNEEYQFRNEIPHRVRKVLETLDEAIESSKWKENHYPHLCAPFSPCVILQWTYRDSTIVNLPWALLVEGDVIVLRPGQEVPGHCRGLQPEDPEQFFGQIFQPTTPQKDNFSTPRIRTPHRNKAYRMCETPYLKNLKLALEQATVRPVTVFEKQRYLCTVKIMEGIVLPLVISLVVIASFVRHVYHLPGVTHWTEIYFLQTIAASLPLLQIVFPIAWVTLNCFGLARFKLLSETRQKYVRPKSCSISEDASDPLIKAMSESNLQPENLKSLGKTFFNILTGREDMVCRTANIVHVLGSLSALSCVDKKGILSWPNPTAEKVFFLRNSSPSSHNSSKTSLVGSMGHQSDEQLDTPVEGTKTAEPSTIVEVLDLTHDQNAPFCVEFDDQRWRQHLARLKPLGLAALLNTCAPAPRHTYAHFCAHLTCEAQYSEDLVPVTNRRCLCELAKQIGFTDSVTDSYQVQECLAIFRQLQADTIRRETRFVRSLQLSTKVKVPLPHMLAVIVKDQANQLQMLTQGTADIILDSCVDYWNGRDLTPISPADRKKIIDFYQRNSLTAYCTAFAYKPLTRGISPSLSALYLELPADSRPLYAPRSQTWADAPALHFHSTDSLLFNEVTDEDVKDADGFFDMQCNQVFIGMVTMQYQAQSDMVELIERLERACIRFVHFSKENELRSRVFSEKMGLESGWNCHISLMSEESASKSASPLSSQTLAQGKDGASAPAQLSRHVDYDAAALGLYYSSNIASSKALSMSAPGAINLDHNTVKFDNEIKKARHSITTHTNLKFQRSSISTSHPSADSLLDDEEDAAGSPADACRSLSCLTDSTDHSAPVNFDMSNRAKLPRGIENIRPHIEQVDNVPLLVSLFTDCTARSVQQMVQIMQDYGEVVCVMGSAANCLNMDIFMQADASIAVEPLYPVLCQKMPPYQVPESCIGPIDLARALNSVPCSLSLQNKWQDQPFTNYCSQKMSRDADVSLFALIAMSRHYMTCLWNSTQFWICSVCFIALLQVGSLVAFQPLSLSVGGAVWGGALVVPAVAAALAFAPLDPALMQRAATRPQLIMNAKMAVFVFWCYALKFLPAALSILVLYGFTLRAFCEQIAEATNATACWIVYPVNVGEFNATHDLTTKSWHGWGDDFYDGFFLAQHITLALITLHLIVISLSFVHRQSSVWQKGFWANRVWSVTVVVIILAQLAFSGIMLSSSYGFCEKWGLCELRYHVPWPLWLGYAASLFLVFALNELIKWQEIKVDGRNQRRARLDFGTKLGMNSPF